MRKEFNKLKKRAKKNGKQNKALIKIVEWCFSKKDFSDLRERWRNLDDSDASSDSLDSADSCSSSNNE